LGDRAYQFRLLATLHVYRRRLGDFSALVPIARQAASIAPELADPRAVAAAHVMLGASHHLTGHLAEARNALTAALQHPRDPRDAMSNVLSVHAEAQFVTARTLWLHGLPDQALDAVREAEFAQQRLGPLATCQALILALHVFNFRGDWAIVEA